jgi:hypothetical protein
MGGCELRLRVGKVLLLPLLLLVVGCDDGDMCMSFKELARSSG